MTAQGAQAHRAVGSVIDGKYELEGLLGEGGMGVVYRARHRWTHRPVAVKVLGAQAAASEEAIARFMREARSAAALRHPNVVDVLDMGRDEHGVYLALELLEGESLAQVLRRVVRLPLDETLRYLLPVMDALAAAHRHGIVHRDLKPDNIFLARSEKGEIVPKLLDFGIAKVRSATNSIATQAGLIIGTPAYMSPEQVRGAEHVGVATDIWAMGIVLYESLSGVYLFSETLPQVSLVRILTEAIPQLDSSSLGLPPAVAMAVHRALEKEPTDRFGSIDELADALRSAAGVAADFGRTPVPASSRPAPKIEHRPSGPGPQPGAGSGVVPRIAFGLANDAQSDEVGSDEPASSPLPRRRLRGPLAIALAASLVLLAWLLRSRDPELPVHLVAPAIPALQQRPLIEPTVATGQLGEPSHIEKPVAEPAPALQPTAETTETTAAHRSRAERPHGRSRALKEQSGQPSQPGADVHNPASMPAPAAPPLQKTQKLGSERRAPELETTF